MNIDLINELTGIEAAAKALAIRAYNARVALERVDAPASAGPRISAALQLQINKALEKREKVMIRKMKR